MSLKIKRGTDAERLTITPLLGEPIFTTDKEQLFIGNGTTVGGVMLHNNCIVKNNITISHTGTLAETIIYSVLIPSGTFQANDDFDFFARIFANNSVNLKTLRLYFNDTNDLVSATQIARRNTTDNTTAGGAFHRILNFKNSLIVQEGVSFDSNYSTDYSLNSLVLSPFAIDFTVNQYLILSATLFDVADIVGVRNLRGQIVR